MGGAPLAPVVSLRKDLKMSIKDFTEAKRQHDNLVDILSKSLEGGNSVCVHSQMDTIYSQVNFSFSIKRGSHSYENSDRVAHFIGEACKCLSVLIIEKAKELSAKNLLEIAKSAKEEAEEVIGTIKSFEDEQK